MPLDGARLPGIAAFGFTPANTHSGVCFKIFYLFQEVQQALS